MLVSADRHSVSLRAVDACRPAQPFDASAFHINIAEGGTESAGKPPPRRAVPPDLETAAQRATIGADEQACDSRV